MRNIYSKGKIGQLTQGSIITGCIAEEFPDLEVNGCVITPRCDLGHEGKVNTVHYLPIVPFENWFSKLAVPEVFLHWKSELAGSIDNIMKEAGCGEKITSFALEKEDVVKLAETKISGKNLNSIRTKIDCFFCRETDKEFKDYLLQVKGKHIDYLKLLKENKLSSYYLLEKWDKTCKSEFYVMLLRDVRRLSFATAKKISKGVWEQDLNPINQQVDDLHVSATGEGFYYIDSQIESPYVEHILEAFMYNFNRIGVEDMPSDTHESLVKIAGRIKF